MAGTAVRCIGSPLDRPLGVEPSALKPTAARQFQAACMARKTATLQAAWRSVLDIRLRGIQAIAAICLMAQGSGQEAHPAGCGGGLSWPVRRGYCSVDLEPRASYPRWRRTIV